MDQSGASAMVTFAASAAGMFVVAP